MEMVNEEKFEGEEDSAGSFWFFEWDEVWAVSLSDDDEAVALLVVVEAAAFDCDEGVG